MEKEMPKVLYQTEHGLWTRPEFWINTSIVWEKRGTGTMKYGRISLEPFPGEDKETASDWMLMEGIPLFVTLETADGRKFELLCQVDPELSIQRAFDTLVECQKFFMNGPAYRTSLSGASHYPALLLTWLSDFELEVSIVPDLYTACELPADSELITSLLQKTGRDKLGPYVSYDGFKVGGQGGRRYTQWKYEPPQERLVRLVVIPEGLQTIITAEDFYDSLMKMWRQIIERMGRDEVGISRIEGLEKTVKSLRNPETDKMILEHRKKQAEQPANSDLIKPIQRSEDNSNP